MLLLCTNGHAATCWMLIGAGGRGCERACSPRGSTDGAPGTYLICRESKSETRERARQFANGQQLSVGPMQCRARDSDWS
eukprot:969323-Rhodomonas_salina.4